MRILVLSTIFPDDPTRKVHGVYKRLGVFVEALKGLGRLDLLFFVRPETDASPDSVARYRETLSRFWDCDLDLTLVHRQPEPRELSRWQAYGPTTIDAFRQHALQWANGRRQREALEAGLERSPDLLFVHRLPSMAPVLGTRRAVPPVLFDLDDVEHRRFARSIPQRPVWPAKRLLYLQVPALWWAERSAIALADRTFVCSEHDRVYLERTMRVNGVRVIPNAVPIPDDPPVLPAAPTALFLGSLSYGPNKNAAVHLMRKIWPGVRARVPDARLIIAGRYAEQVPGYADPPDGVEFTGFVESIEDVYVRTRVVCVPILSGGGTRIKILEGAAFGRPVVATTVGAEGLDLEDGRHLLVRDDPAAFAEAVAGLMLDDARADALARAGRERVSALYGHDRVIPRIREEALSCLPAVIRSLARDPRPASAAAPPS